MAWIFTSDGNYVNFNGGGNLWRLHKDSACITWHWDQTGDLFFDVYGQEYTVKAANIADVVINGTPLSAASGFPAAIQAVFTGLYAPGGGSLLSATVELTDAQIKALPTTPITLIAGQSGKAISVQNVFLKGDFTAGVYTNKNGDWSLGYNTDLIFNGFPSAAIIEDSSNVWALTYYPANSGTFDNINLYDNVPIVLSFDNSGFGNLTGGNAANTLKVTVYYVVVDL